MTSELVLVLSLLLVAILMFMANKPRMDVVALLMLVALPFTGVLTVDEVLAGFSNPNVVLIAAVYVISDGLVRTGLAKKLSDWLASKAGDSEARLIVLLMMGVCGLGAFMSTTAVTLIFIPVALRLSQRTGAPPSRLMMPLSVAALISGMMTLIGTTPNLVVNSELHRQGLPGFGFLSITPFGLVAMVLGIVYMLFAKRWLSADAEKSASSFTPPTLLSWLGDYKLIGRTFRVSLRPGSCMVGKRLGELDPSQVFGVNIVAIERKSRFGFDILQPTDKRRLLAKDILLIDLGSKDVNFEEVRVQLGFEELPLSDAHFNDLSQEIGMAEVMVPEGSFLIGKTVIGGRFRSKTGLSVIGVKRGQDAIDQDLFDKPINVGDVLLVIGPWSDIHKLNLDASGVSVLRLPAELKEVVAAPGKLGYALLCLGAIVALMVSGKVANVHAALIGCLLMGLWGCVDMNSAYRSIEWKTVILVVGMMPFAIALQKTGGVSLVVDLMGRVVDASQPHLALAMLYVMTMLMGMLMSNTATAVLMAPVSLKLAAEMNLSPYPFAMIVCLGASTAFITPLSSPVNMLVMTPGNYKFLDFVRIGLPLAAVVLLVSVLFVPMLWPF